MREHDFDEKIRRGEIGEATLDSVYDYEQYPDIQRSGIDGQVDNRTVEVKVREFYIFEQWTRQGYMDILLETVSVVETDTLGWILTSQADILRYGILNQTGHHLMFYYDYHLPCLRAWYIANKERYSEQETTSTRDGLIWHTRFVLVPMSHIPRKCTIPTINKKEAK